MPVTRGAPPGCANPQSDGPRNRKDNNIRVIRYADVLLMNAQANVRLGQNGDAPLNQIDLNPNLAEAPVSATE